MKISKNELKEALEIVKPGLANREIIEQSTSFAFLKGRVVTFNNEISVSHPIKGLEVEGTIQAEELYKFISKVREDEIKIVVKNDEVILKSGRATAGFSLIGEITLPLGEELAEKGKWHPIPLSFIKAIDFASMSCATDLSTPKLTCVHVNKENNFIESCDNHRITRYKIEGLPLDTFLLPAVSIKTIVKQNPIEIAEGNGWVHFRTKQDTIISCRILKEDFVNTDQFFRKRIRGIKITLPTDLDIVIEKAIIFTKDSLNEDKVIDITITDKTLMVEAKSEAAWFKETLPIVYEGEEISFPITPYMLLDILEETRDCILVDNLLYFKGKNWTYLTVHYARMS